VEISRNQYFMVGVIVLLLGIQFRFVETAVLNERATQFLAERSKNSAVASGARFLPARSKNRSAAGVDRLGADVRRLRPYLAQPRFTARLMTRQFTL